jgi:hypothetical protein
VTRLARLRRPLVIAMAVVVCAWTLAAPVAAKVLYRTPTQQPHGAAKLIFYCHLH